MLPGTNHFPASVTQFGSLPEIARLVFSKFGKPIRLIAFGKCRVNRASVPETTIYEYSDLGRDENDIDKYAFDSTMDPIA